MSKHWFWDNWIILSFMAVLSFTIANYFISAISGMGVRTLYYFSTGSLVFAIIYFIQRREWSRLNDS